MLLTYELIYAGMTLFLTGATVRQHVPRAQVFSAQGVLAAFLVFLAGWDRDWLAAGAWLATTVLNLAMYLRVRRAESRPPADDAAPDPQRSQPQGPEPHARAGRLLGRLSPRRRRDPDAEADERD